MLLPLLLVLTGCLPTSCRRDPPTALFPSDSLSRQIAEATPVDTLDFAWVTEITGEDAYPRTVLWGREGRLYLSDGQGGRVLRMTADGKIDAEIGGFEKPFLTGFRADTLVVFNPEAQRLDFVAFAGATGRTVRSLPTPTELPEEGRLQYAAASDAALYIKLLGTSFDNHLARLDPGTGAVTDTFRLSGPTWRRAGLLRFWGDSLLSLSGFRPVVDVVAPGAARVDTLALAGFDSPKLAASLAFMQGEARQPALLTAAAAPAGDHLFVLNMRPGWLRIDVYDRGGRLQRVLMQPDPGYLHHFYPQDLAARALPDGTFEIAVAFSEPTPQVRLYRWKGL